MTPRICRCCGESMTSRSQQLSRNPNVCASCSSLLDGMGEEFVGEDDASRKDATPAENPEAIKVTELHPTQTRTRN